MSGSPVSGRDSFSLDPALDPERLAGVFSVAGRMHLPGILTPASAARLYEAVTACPDWTLSTLGRGHALDIPASVLAAADEGRRQALMEAAHAQAREGFHYIFETVRIEEVHPEGPQGAVLRAFLRWLNSEVFLEFARRISGLGALNRVDAQVTRYRPGHYLTQHTDEKPGTRRRLAYVLNLTPRWRVDWGGLLGFVDDDGHIAEAYCPAFNALNLFRVPQPHLVSLVAPFAPAYRLSITGWIHAD
jgi:SM-20-related protein